jgi:uncharacterized Fe-S center protein
MIFMTKRFRNTVITLFAVMLACFAFTAATAAPVKSPAGKNDVAIVYFTRDISPAGLLKIYNKVNEGITGKVAIKIHTGEPHGPNILPVPMVKALQQRIPNSNLVETNTYYQGGRYTTEDHRRTLKVNGWTFCKVDIMDENGTVMLPVKGGRHFKEMSMGKDIMNYDSMVVLTHFKGHTMGGFGGSIKNIAIGCADGRIGKKMIHTRPGSSQWSIDKDEFMENMAESAKATVDHFGKHITFINVMRRMSVDCDCAGTSAAEPKIPDIGILASKNIVALDQACIDKVFGSPEKYKHDLWERITSRHGLTQLSYGEKIGLGTRKYKLVSID